MAIEAITWLGGFWRFPAIRMNIPFTPPRRICSDRNQRALRRFTYRLDGFVSVSSATESGAVLTRALTFEGHEMAINASTQPEGNVHAEIQMEGQTVAESESFTGNSTGQVLRWKSDADLGALAGKAVQVRFVLQNADLYSFQFR